MSRSLGRQIYIQYVDLMWQVTLMTVYHHLFRSLIKSVKKVPYDNSILLLVIC